VEVNARLFCVCIIGLPFVTSNDGARLLFGKCAAHPVATSGLRPLNTAKVNYMFAPGVLVCWCAAAHNFIELRQGVFQKKWKVYVFVQFLFRV